MIHFTEPVSTMLACAQAEYPSLRTKIVLVSGMAIDEGAWGQTWWPDASGELHPDWQDGIDALVMIDAVAPYYALPDITAHELAHVVAGPDGGHGEAFAAAYLRIHAAFCRAHGEEPTPALLAELQEAIECARTGRDNGTAPDVGRPSIEETAKILAIAAHRVISPTSSDDDLERMWTSLKEEAREPWLAAARATPAASAALADWQMAHGVWRLADGDRTDELVAIHGPHGHTIASGLTMIQATALLNAHNNTNNQPIVATADDGPFCFSR